MFPKLIGLRDVSYPVIPSRVSYVPGPILDDKGDFVLNTEPFNVLDLNDETTGFPSLIQSHYTMSPVYYPGPGFYSFSLGLIRGSKKTDVHPLWNKTEIKINRYSY